MRQNNARALVTIDLTNEQWGNGSKCLRNDRVLSVQEKLLGGGDDAPVWDAIFDCRNWIYNKEDSAFTSPSDGLWQGGVPGTQGAELIPSLKALRDAAELPDATTPKWKFVGKPDQSCLYDTTMEHALRELNINELYISGINTQFCVFGTTYDAWRSRVVDRFFMIEDASTTCYGEEDGHQLGLRMVGTILSNRGAIINSTDIPRMPSPSVFV